MTVGIVGAGWVGKAQANLFTNAIIYDKFKEEYRDNQDAFNCDVVFVSVPTDPLPTGELDMSNVDEAVSKCGDGVIVIRSTLNPRHADYLATKYNRRIVVMPEYTGMSPAHPNTNMSERSFLIFGGDAGDVERVVKLYATVNNANTKIRRVTRHQAEIIKLTENRAIAFKVMQMHELYLACKGHFEDYVTIRDAVFGDDWRFNLWFTFIYEDENGKEKLGFESSHCLSKDLPAWRRWAREGGFYPAITSALISQSKEWNGKSAAEILEAIKLENYRAGNGVYS